MAKELVHFPINKQLIIGLFNLYFSMADSVVWRMKKKKPSNNNHFLPEVSDTKQFQNSNSRLDICSFLG
jgi:hypothetical protein